MFIDLKTIKKVHFIGIKGVAMSGLAVICKQKGLEVKGSDVPKKFITDKVLEGAGIEFFSDFAASNLDWQPDLVVVGTSWGVDHVEVVAAKNKEIKIITDSELRGTLSLEKKTIAVTGVHGKTTTSALLTHIFKSAGLKPSFLVGTGSVPDLGSNAAWDEGDYFIVEADEYARSHEDKTPKFLDLESYISIVTSLEWEHVDIYENVEALEKVFSQLLEQTAEMSVVCADWPSIKKIILGKKNVVTYGFYQDNLWQAHNVEQKDELISFVVSKEGIDLDQFSLKLLGDHNVLNALACIIVSLKVGIEMEEIRKALVTFSGTERRSQMSEKNGVIFIDDYGHHPSEVKAILKAIRSKYQNKKIICLFQPHMASRTKALLDDFADSFSGIDQVFITDIFTSAREGVGEVTAQDLVEVVRQKNSQVAYVGNLQQALEKIKPLLDATSVLVTMGAGDVYLVRDQLVQEL
ncbi:MAG: UDP-N-acetylmuramate--L-alanine ligase [Candidatus Buchananbacteria bacterium]|nr:UDP-N-acetylmuramate--L-alanine ligase [Candidatus Buchananbacteria bacterium]